VVGKLGGSWAKLNILQIVWLVLGFAALLILRRIGILSVRLPDIFLLVVSSFGMTGNSFIMLTSYFNSTNFIRIKIGNVIHYFFKYKKGFLLKI